MRTFDGKHYMQAVNGGGAGLSANPTIANGWETFTMNGRLEYGGKISLQTSDGKHYVQAVNGGGAGLSANPTGANQWETFTIISHDGKPDGSPIINGSKVALQTFNCQHYICAENGGGGEINATRFKDLGWETFTVKFL